MKLKNYLLTIILCAINSTPFSIKRVKNYGLIHVQLLLLAVFLNTTSHAQTFKTFTKRYSAEYKGDMLAIGNNILGKNNSALNDNTLLNENVSMQYIDIDSDASTFDSSSADLSIPSTVSCFRIAYAGLYWGAIIKTGDSRTDIEKIKLKLPGNTSYTDINGEIIYDAVVAPIVPDSNKPYACYADVTSLLSGLTNPQGTYTAANIKSSIGSNGGTGLAAGWTLFVVYEDPSSSAKSMSSFDGFSALYDGKTLDIDINGFRTPSTGTINLKFAFANLNGDKSSSKSKVEISNGTANGTSIVTTQRPSNDFFNSAITDINGYFSSRNPSGTNSLGYDTGIEQLLNVNKSTVDHDATTARVTLQVAKGQANPIFSFFNAFAVDIIAPEIKLTKIVKDINGNDIGNTNVSLGDNLYYEIGFQNIGNDNVDKFTLKDVLPTNVIFNYPADITSLPAGVTHSYNSTTRTLQFSIPNSLVEVGDVAQTIRLHVQLISDYSQLSVGCSNEIKNQAFATYQGVINTKVIQDEGSFSTTTCNFGTPSSTNFLVNIDGHTYTKTSVLCGASTTLSAADGYTSYSWSTSSTGTPVISTNQSYTATSTGTYYVTSTSSCRTIKEEITVIPFGNTITNPVIPYADEVATCQNNGKALPNIFLCGANASRLIQTNISDASSIEWEKLNESSCAAQTIANCANENTACQWNVVSTGANFSVNAAGQYRVTLKYSGGCFSRFYFNVYQNLLNPTYTTKDIVCTTNGKITIGGVPAGYEYSLNNVDYQSSNIFTITTAGSYTVYIRQVGVTTNPCIFSVPNILIRKRNFSGTTITTQPSCNGDKGSIKIAAVDADPQYYYSISQGATLVNSVGPITASDYEFSGLNAGTYTVRVWTDDGCDYSTTITITNPPLLTATSALTKPLTCTDGEITVYPVGGTPPYAYYINGSTSSQSVPQIVVTNSLPTGGVYSIEVVDSKNCKATTSITVAAISPPVYTISQTNILCYNNTTGEIKFNVSNTNSYTLAYSIDNGATYVTNPTFSNLSAGTYNAIVKYSLAGTNCYSTAQTITITQPSTALTASAGVSELAGCGPSGEGKIRITNPQGGTPFPSPNFYLYSFDNQANWVTTNEAYLMPGTYTVYIKDTNGCIYPMSVTIDAVPAAPTIAVDSSSFNCDGTATSTVTVTNNGGSNYSYQYLIDGTVNPNTADPKIFLNVPSGSHTISVKYQLLSVSTYSNLLNEDFGSGSEVSSPGINAAFCFEKQNFLTCDKNGTLNNGEYTVTNTIKNGIYSGWNNPVDHTAGSSTGRYLAVDAGTAIPNNAVLYRKTIQDIIPNQPIQVRFFATNLLKVGNTQPDASLTVELQNSAGTALSSQSTGAIPKTNGWVEYNRTIDPGNNTTLDFVLRLELAQVNGIDFAVDDIQVYQLPKSCTIQKDFAVVIPTNQAFDASVTGSQNITCSGASNGTITVAAQNFNTINGFQYSINGGGSWTTQLTSPYTITGLTAGTYNLQIRYDAASTGTCVKSFTQILTAPTVLTTNASISSLATCSTGATITASATGGTAAYRYELWDAAGTTNIRPSQNSGIFSNVPAASYIVRGYDANNCSDDSPAVTVVNPAALTATLDSSSDLCYDTANQASLTVNVSGGVSPFVYSLDGAASQNSNTFTNVGVGTHSILVTDSNNCTATISNIIIAPQLQMTATLSQDLSCLVDASINATVTGGNAAPYTYTVSRNGGAAATVASFPYTATLDGNYVFTVTDSKGCSATSNTIIVSPKTTPSLTFTKTDISCNNANDGTITVTASNGFTSAYTYAIKLSSASTYTTQSSNQFTALAAGTYNIKVIDSKGCESAVSNVIIANPTAIIGNISATDLQCSTSGTVPAVVTVTASVGIAPYKYSFNGTSSFTTTNTFSTTTAGNVDAYIQDANGCQIGPLSVTIGALEPITDITIVDNGYDCSTTPQGGQVTLTAVKAGTANPISYQIISGPAGYNATANSTGIFQGLAGGSYIFQATDTKTNCSFTKSYTVNGTPAITAGGSVVTPITCFGGTGNIEFTISGISASGYDYVIKDAVNTAVASNTSQTASTVNLNNLAANSYTITVTDRKTKCTATYTITLGQPSAALAISAVATNVNCNNDNSQITATVTGGTPNYTYAAVISGATAPITSAYNNNNIITVDTNSAANLVWDVYVKDVNGCIEKTTVTVISDPMPAITSVVVNNQCTASGSNFTITATGTGGVAPLTYGIGGATGAFQSGNTFTVVPGTYTVWVKDANGCAVPAATSVTVSPQLTASSAVTKTLDCSATPDAVITTTITGGKAPYTYTVQKGSGTASAPSAAAASFTYNVSNVNADSYTFVITDANGCTFTTSATINPITNPTVSETHVNPLCNGAANGSVQLTASGGSGGYTYSFDGSPFTNTTSYTGLKAGIVYSYQVKDSNGCVSLPATITLTEPTTLTVSASTTNFSCSATNTKQAAVVTIAVPTTGTAPYTYSFNGGGFTSTNTLTVNDNGTDQTINYSVKDANGCIQAGTAITINKLNPPTAGTITNSAVTCTATTSTVTVTPTAGTGVGTLTYEIVFPTASAALNTSGVFNGLAPDTYIFKVTDANGCYYTQSITVNPVTPIAVIPTKLTDVDCFGNTTGSIRYNVSGFTSYSYSVNGGTAITAQTAATFTLSNLASGSYNLVFTDQNTGCTASTSTTITQPAAALTATYTTVNANCFTATSQVTVIASGGTSAYTYSFVVDNAAAGTYTASNIANLDPALVWDVWVKDANGCTFKLDLVITKDPAPTVTASAVGQCLGVGSYTITANGTGKAPLTYSINNGSYYQSGNTFVVTASGNYTVRIKDANGCTSDSNTITVAPQLTLSAVLNKDITCNPTPTEAQITITPAGGTAPFTYESKEASGSYVAMTNNVFNSAVAGSYTFRVTDANGCTAVTTTPIVLTAPINPEIIDHTPIQDIYCNGEATAAVKINIDSSKGTAPFSYSIDGTNFQSSNVFSSLAAGTYTVTLKDSKGCTDTYNLTINEPTALNYTLSKTDIICASMTLGTITVDVSSGLGGTAPYTYILTNNAGYPAQTLNYATATNHTFNNLDFGTYYFTVVDANGCSLKTTVDVTSPPDNLDIVVETTADCSSGGTVKVTATGALLGTGPFYFAIYQKDPATGLYPMAPTFTPGLQPPFQAEDSPRSTTFTGLLQGVIYSFIVYDQSTGCSYIKEASTPTVKATSLATLRVVTDVTCKGSADGTVSITLDKDPSAAPGYTPPTSVDYAVYDSKTNKPLIPANDGLGITVGTYPFTMPLIGGLAPGSYYVVITEHGGTNDGCSSATLPFDIYESATDLEITATVVKKDNCNLDAGQIVAIAKGGTTMSREDLLAVPAQIATPIPYQYQILPDTGIIGNASDDTAPLATDTNWNTTNTFMKESGNYIIYAMDANKCIKSFPITLDSDIAPTINTPASICYDGNPFNITITGTVDPAIVGSKTYSVNGSTFQTSPSFTFNPAGTYNLVIKDGNGCTADVDYEVYPQLNLSATLTKELDCSASPNATITLTTTGGNTTPAANHTYEVSTNGGGTWATMATNVYTATTAGTYDFRVTDANNTTLCQATTTFTLDPIPTTVFTTTETNVSCNAGADGTITVNVTSGVGPYEYQLDAGTFQSSNVFTGLAARTTYVITVRNAKNCTLASSPITISQPAVLTATSSLTTPLTCGTGNVAQPATVTVNGVNGTAPYQYSFDGGNNYSATNTYQSYTGTTFNVYVKDAKGCIFILNNGVNIPALVPPTDLTFNTTSAVTCLAPGTVEISGHTGGVGTLQYQTIAPSPIIIPQQTSTTFSGLTPGTYLFQVTDGNGCTYREAYTVNPVTNITVAGQLISDVTCNETPAVTNGAVTFTVGNFANTYSYSVNGVGPVTGQTAATINLTALGTGNQVIVVTDEVTGCTATTSVTVSQPLTPLTLTEISNINANCNSGAKVNVLANGGTPNYTYAFVADNATPLATDYTASASAVLPFITPAPNNYDVWVKDNNGCTYKLDIQINTDASPVITMPAQQCYVGSTLSVDLNTVTTTYNGTKSYTVNGSPIATSMATFNAPGSYVLGIKDDHGCEAFVTYIIEKQLLASAILTKDLYCAAPVNATIDVTITDGVAPYTYQMYLNGAPTGGSTAIVGSSFTASVATAGTYTFEITDSNATSCKFTTNAVNVTTPATPTATFTQTNVSCNGGADGTITITAANGIAAYQYSIDNGVNYQASNVFTGLTDAGIYNIVVKDAKGCTSVAIPVDITQPPIVTASAVVTPFGCNTSNAPQDAIVTITPGGGTPGYTYSFDGGSTFQTSPSFAVNKAQTINYVVHDANGCIASGSATVLPYTPPTDMNLTATPIYCSTPGTVATVTVNAVTAGVAPYTYEIISPASAVTAPSATNSFANLAPNTYVIKVTDANGCSTTKAIEVKEANKISVTSQLVNNVFCKGGATGAVNFMVSNYITAGNYTYNLSPAAGTSSQTGDLISYTGLPAGTYTFTVTDGVSGCQASVVNFAISEPAIALSSSSVATNINCNNDNATITITANGGTAPYKYAVAKASVPIPVTASFIASNQLIVDTNNGADMNWTVYVKDANGCDVNNPQTILVDTNPTIANAVATQCPSPTGTYTITVTANGFNSSLQYSVDGVSFQTSNVIAVNAPGTYNVTVKDANGCSSASTSVTIVQPLTLTPRVTTMPSCTDNDGVITVNSTGGSGNYVYNIDGGAFAAATTFNNVASGSHSMGVRDTTTLCEVYIPITLTPATAISGFALSKTDINCNAGNNGSITATMTTPAPGVNDNPVYMYSLSGTATRPAQASNIFTGLTAGNYTVTVVSGRACTASAAITIAEPAIITVPTPTVAQFGCTSGNAMNFATITANNVTGGSGSYTIYEFFKNGVSVQKGASNVYTEANLTGGSYTVTVYDNKGCQGSTTAPITIAPYIALNKINVTVNSAITCTNLENITVTASSIGGTPTNLQYTLVDKNATTGITAGVYPSQTNTTGVFTGLPVANYLITVKNLDTGCEIQDVHYVSEPNTFDLTIDTIVDVSCFGGTNGSANVTIIDSNTANGNQAGAFSYTITGPVGSSGSSPTAGPFTLGNLVAGTYTITATLTNSPFCQVSKAFTINQPTTALKISETHTQITCIPGSDGTISATAAGGWPGGYQFELSGPVNVAYSAQSNFTNLSAGLYTIRVKDSKGCVDQIQVTLANPTPIAAIATPSTTVLSCFGDKNATITVTNVTGGQGSNYSYILNTILPSPTSSGPQLSPTFSGLGAGTYTVTVKDTYNCSFTSANIVITEPTVVKANLVVASTQTCLNQTQLTLTASGGTAPYSYSDTANFATSTAITGNSTTFSVPVGTYRYYIKDANGCTSVVSNNIKIDPLPALVINLDKTNAFINCKGDNSGDIVATAQGGLGNYVYSLLDGAGNPVTPTPTQLSPGNFTGLFAGNYMVKVTSGDCTTTSALISITEPTAPLAAPYTTKNVSCNGAKNGEIVINATGGTGTIQYAISPNLNQFYNTNTFTNLVPGNYNVIVQDKLGCYIKINFDITEPNLLTASTTPNSIVPEICAGDKDGAFSIDIAGGTAPYSVSLDNLNGTYTTGSLSQTEFDFTGLRGGNHVVYIRDAAGCTTDWSVPLPESINMSPVAVVTYDCVNNAAANLVTVTVDSSITNPADVDYSLDGGSYQAGNTFTNIPAGTHFVRTRHTNGCEQQTTNFNVAQIDPLTLVLNDGGLNEIVATATGGGGNYQYTLNGESYGDTHNFIIYKSGNYTVTVTDANGCVASATRYFEYIDVCIPNHFTPNGDGVQDGWAPGCTINYKDLTFDIFDRYGRKVASYRLGQYWDGKYNGSELPTGDYWYVIRLNDPKDNREFVGHFTLYR